MTGHAPDLAATEAVAEGLWWGLLAPETCPDSSGRLEGASITPTGRSAPSPEIYRQRSAIVALALDVPAWGT